MKTAVCLKPEVLDDSFRKKGTIKGLNESLQPESSHPDMNNSVASLAEKHFLLSIITLYYSLVIKMSEETLRDELFFHFYRQICHIYHL